MEMSTQRERRTGQPPVPPDIGSHLTDLQRAALARVESFGWSVEFVRRPLFQDPVVVLTDPTRDRHVVLIEDGSLDYDHDLTIRP